MQFIFDNCDIIIQGTEDFSLSDTLDCGQCFRWYSLDSNTYTGVVAKKHLTIIEKDNRIILKNTSKTDFENLWKNYFDLGTDYTTIKKSFDSNEILLQSTHFAPGIRVLRQEGWEALCSFIISQNNNLKRIKGIVKALCEKFGEKLPCGEYAFPSPLALANSTIEEIQTTKCGFRAKYIYDAACKVATKEINLKNLYTAPIEEARTTLQQIKGVGPKVAECALLYGFARMECFPQDVWIKRAMKILFPNGLPQCANNHLGIAQQFIFHYARTCPEALGLDKKLKVN